MSAYTGGTAIWRTDGLAVGNPQTKDILSVDNFRDPYGTLWVSRGAYEQSLKLAAAELRIRELEAEVYRLGFPVEGMAGRWDGGVMYVWPSLQDADIGVEIKKRSCDFCEAGTSTVFIGTEEYGHLDVCQECLNKMFEAFWKRVAG